MENEKIKENENEDEEYDNDLIFNNFIKKNQTVEIVRLFQLNIEKLSRKISDKLSDFKNNISNENKDLAIVCKDKVKTYNNKEKNMEVIEKKDFFEIMEKYGVICEEEIKDAIVQDTIDSPP